jgi:hypothetical protein
VTEITGSNRVNRGGGWNNDAVNCRSANRNHDAPGNRNDNLGFRLVSTSRCRWDAVHGLHPRAQGQVHPPSSRAGPPRTNNNNAPRVVGRSKPAAQPNLLFACEFHTLRRIREAEMNPTIYATILTGLGVVITLIVTMHNLAKINQQQETNRRIDELRHETTRWIDDSKQDTNRRIDEGKQETNRRIEDSNRRIDEFRQDVFKKFDDLRQDFLGAVDSKSKVTDARFELVGVRFQRLESDTFEIRQEVQVIKKELFKNAA